MHSQGNRSHTILLDLYLSKIPGEARQATNRFYLKPLPFRPTGVRPWFWDSPVGTKRLQTMVQPMVKNMMEEAMIPGNFTNHSLRAIGTTTLFDAPPEEAAYRRQRDSRWR